MTQAELARETQIAQAHLSRAERDSYDLGHDRLAVLAAYLEFPFDFFTTAPIAEFGGRPVHFRARAAMRMKQADQATRAGEVVVEAVIRMEQHLEGPRLQLPPPQTDPLAAATAARQALSLKADDAAIGLPILLEHVGVTVLGLPLPAQRRDAFSLWLGDRPVLALLDTDAGDRQLWSTAHELGHLLLHRNLPASKDIEAAADEFAMHLLLPIHVLDREMPSSPIMSDFAILKRRWGVSIAALIRMARRLERITQDQYTSLFKQMSARGERLRERTFIPAIKPRGLRAMAELTYGPSPAPGLAAANKWSVLFAEQVLARHARVEDLPVRVSTASERPNNVVAINAARNAGRRL